MGWFQSVPISVQHARTTQLQAWPSVQHASLDQPSIVLTRRAEVSLKLRSIIVSLYMYG